MRKTTNKHHQPSQTKTDKIKFWMCSTRARGLLDLTNSKYYKSLTKPNHNLMPHMNTNIKMFRNDYLPFTYYLHYIVNPTDPIGYKNPI